jgi:hypothetical protein
MKRDQLRPWQALPAVSCDRCDRQATMRVYASSMVVLGKDGDGVVQATFTDDAGQRSALACSSCYRTAMDDISKAQGGAGAQPLRDSWRIWFRWLPVIRQLDDWLVIPFQNWRFERHSEKAFRRAMACPEHELDARRVCTHCGIQLL